ncbi:MAG: hypothetical protein M3416_00010 [Acidobacteriota bacterium]|nr:hypothetical protein [Acidobacteriota bacterium]
MSTLSEVLRYEMLFLLVGLIVLVAYRLLTQQINTKGLLLDKASGRAFSPGRLQLLIVTMGIAIYYMLMVFETEEPGRFPDLPNEFLLALGGSHVFYLGGKLYGLLASRLGFASPLIRERARQISERRMKR